jgi:hypothetical protein
MHRGSAAHRETLLFSVYEAQGTARSLTQLHRHLRELGLDISLPTLKRYSARYRWQERLKGIADETRTRRHEQTVAETLQVLDRHGQLARALQAAGGSALQHLITNQGRLAGLSPNDIARLLELGLRTEAQASSLVASRRELAFSLANVMTNAVASLFEDVNGEADPEHRARARRTHPPRAGPRCSW